MFYKDPAYEKFQEAIDGEPDLPCQSWPELFFPEPGPGRNGDPGTEAKRLCRGCPIRLQCLDYALTANEEYGIWGGLGPKERDRLKRNARRTAR